MQFHPLVTSSFRFIQKREGLAIRASMRRTILRRLLLLLRVVLAKKGAVLWIQATASGDNALTRDKPSLELNDGALQIYVFCAGTESGNVITAFDRTFSSASGSEMIFNIAAWFVS